MVELIIIKTNRGQQVKKLLEEKHIHYETYQKGEQTFKISEAELAKAYQEAWSNPQRYKEAQQWERVAVSDWAERAKKGRSQAKTKKNNGSTIN